MSDVKPGVLQQLSRFFYNPEFRAVQAVQFEEAYQRALSNLKEPAGWLLDALGGITSNTGERVTRSSAIQTSAMFSGLDFIASTMAQIPLRVVRITNGKRELLDEHPLLPMLNQRANGQMTAYDTRYRNSFNSELDGNGICIIERDAAGRPVALKPVQWIAVDVRVADKERLLYHTTENHLSEADNRVLEAVDVVHLKRHANSSFLGSPLWAQQRETLGLTQAVRKAAASHFKSGMHQQIGFLYPGNWKEDSKREFQKSYEEKHLGINNKGTVPVVDKGVKPFNMNFSPEASQLLESQKFSIAEVARILRIPSFVINDNDRSTFSNIEELSNSLFKYSFQHRIEADTQELEFKLVPAAQLGKVHIEYDVSWLLKGDFETRAAWYLVMWQVGAFSINDILKNEGMNTIGSDGDKRFVPLNYTTIEKAGNDEAARTVQYMTDHRDLLDETLAKIKKLNGHALQHWKPGI